MIKPILLIKLLRQRLTHNEHWLKQGTAASTGLEKTPGYREAVKEEIAFLRVVLEEKE